MRKPKMIPTPAVGDVVTDDTIAVLTPMRVTKSPVSGLEVGDIVVVDRIHPKTKCYESRVYRRTPAGEAYHHLLIFTPGLLRNGILWLEVADSLKGMLVRERGT